MSALTICEFFEFLVDLSIHGFLVAYKNRQRRRVNAMPMTVKKVFVDFGCCLNFAVVFICIYSIYFEGYLLF